MPESLSTDIRFRLRRLIIGSLILMAAWPVWSLSVRSFSTSAGCHCDFTRANMLSLHNALDFYQLQTGSFPTTKQGLKALIKKPTIAPVPSNWIPIRKQDSLDRWGRPYAYRYPGRKDPSKPEVYSLGADGIEGNEDDLSSQNR